MLGISPFELFKTTMRTTRVPSSTLRAFLFCAALGGSVLCRPSYVLAQDAEELADARAKFQRAIELKQGKNWAGALKLFREVGQVKMTPQVRYHIATCEEGLGQLVAALGGYEIALQQSEGMAEGFALEIQGSIDDLKSRIPKLVIERGEGAEAASIELDGVQLGDSSIGIETPLDPGPHAISASAPGYESYRETVTVSEGSIETLTVSMKELEEESAVGSNGGAQVSESEPLSFGLWPYVVGGAGVAFAGAGGVFLGLSASKAGKVEDLCGGTDCTSLSGDERQEATDLDRSAGTFEMIGWVGVGVGVLALAGGTTMFLLDEGDDKQSDAGLSLVPSAPRSDVGLSLVGNF